MTTKKKEVTAEQIGKDFFQNGVLVCFRAGKYSGKAKVDDEYLDDHNIPKEVISAMQSLFTEEATYLDELGDLYKASRRLIRRYMVPFPIRNMPFVNKKKLLVIDEGLKVNAGLYREIAERFIDDYPRLKNLFKKKYPELYERYKHRYPTKESLLRRFYFQFSYKTIAPPDKGVLDEVDPDMYKREVQTFAREWKETKEEVLGIVKFELLKRINSLAKQCETESVNKATVNSINDYVDKIETTFSGFVESSRIKAVVKDLRKYVVDAGPDKLKDNENFRTVVQEKMKEAAEKLERIPDRKGKLRIDF